MNSGEARTILQLPSSGPLTREQIQDAFRAQIRLHHPDQNNGKENPKTANIIEARTILIEGLTGVRGNRGENRTQNAVSLVTDILEHMNAEIAKVGTLFMVLSELRKIQLHIANFQYHRGNSLSSQARILLEREFPKLDDMVSTCAMALDEKQSYANRLQAMKQLRWYPFFQTTVVSEAINQLMAELTPPPAPAAPKQFDDSGFRSESTHRVNREKVERKMPNDEGKPPEKSYFRPKREESSRSEQQANTTSQKEAGQQQEIEKASQEFVQILGNPNHGFGALAVILERFVAKYPEKIIKAVFPSHEADMGILNFLGQDHPKSGYRCWGKYTTPQDYFGRIKNVDLSWLCLERYHKNMAALYDVSASNPFQIAATINELLIFLRQDVENVLIAKVAQTNSFTRTLAGENEITGEDLAQRIQQVQNDLLSGTIDWESFASVHAVSNVSAVINWSKFFASPSYTMKKDGRNVEVIREPIRTDKQGYKTVEKGIFERDFYKMLWKDLLIKPTTFDQALSILYLLDVPNINTMLDDEHRGITFLTKGVYQQLLNYRETLRKKTFFGDNKQRFLRMSREDKMIKLSELGVVDPSYALRIANLLTSDLQTP